MVFGGKHLSHILAEYVSHYNDDRLHQGVGNRPLAAGHPGQPILPFVTGEVVCEERLGGLLKHYQRRQAA